MKLGDLRRRLGGCTPEQLRLVAVELYRAVPKAVREERALDEFIERPDPKSRRAAARPEPPTFEEVAAETRRFVELAEADNYFAPNCLVSKKERARWRFVVKRLTSELQAHAARPERRPAVAELLEALYNLLCRACQVYLFRSDDPFRAIGIPQTEYLRKVLTLKTSWQAKPAFIREAIASIVTRGTDRHTLTTDLMPVLLEFLPLPDHKYEVIAAAEEMIAATPPTAGPRSDGHRQFSLDQRNNDLTDLVFHCYAQLGEWPNAIVFFNDNYRAHTPEVKLYCLVRALEHPYRQYGLIREQIAAARAAGVKPRPELLALEPRPPAISGVTS